MRARKHQQEAARAKRASRNVIAQTEPGITGADVAVPGPDPSDGKAELPASAEGEAAAYEKFKEEMANEEKKEFRAKLWVSCGLFTAFWLIGSATFMATEGWSYGTATYFCEFP